MSGRHRKGGCLAVPALLVVAVAALLALFGCGATPVSGVVTHRQHSDAYTWQTSDCSAWSTNRVKIGNTIVENKTCVAYTTHTWHHDASWQLCIKGVDKDGKAAEGCKDVPETEYAQYHEGDQYPHPKGPQ